MAHLAGATTAPLRGIGAMNVALKNHLAIVNNLTSTAIPAQIGLMNTVQSSMGNVSAQVAEQGSKWGDWGTNASRAVAGLGASLGGVVSQITNIGQQLLSGDWVGAILSGVGALVGALKGAFGPSKEELGRRDAYHQFASRPRRTWLATSNTSMRLRGRWRRDRRQAHRRGQRRRSTSTGRRREDDRQAAQLHDQFLNSVKSGNVAVMNSILGTVNEWKDAASDSIAAVEVDFEAFFQGVTAEEGAGAHRGVDRHVRRGGGGQPVVRQHDGGGVRQGGRCGRPDGPRASRRP